MDLVPPPETDLDHCKWCGTTENLILDNNPFKDEWYMICDRPECDR